MSIVPIENTTSKRHNLDERYRRSVERTTNRQVEQTHSEMLVRSAKAVAEGVVARQKLREVDNLARDAVIGQAMLYQYIDVLAGADPMLRDDLQVFSNVAKIAKAQIISDTVETFHREAMFRW